MNLSNESSVAWPGSVIRFMFLCSSPGLWCFCAAAPVVFWSGLRRRQKDDSQKVRVAIRDWIRALSIRGTMGQDTRTRAAAVCETHLKRCVWFLSSVLIANALARTVCVSLRPGDTIRITFIPVRLTTHLQTIERMFSFQGV